MAQTLVRHLESERAEIGIETIVDAAYNEHLDPVGGSQLIMTASNRLAHVTDVLGLKSGDILNATISDNDDLNVRGDFRITEIRPLESPEKQIKGIDIGNDDFVSIECVEDNCWRLHELGRGLFHDSTVKMILKDTVPDGVNVETSEYPIVPDYSSFGIKKTGMILKMCRELASFAWYSNGTFHFKKFDDVWNRATSVTTEYDADIPESDKSVRITRMFPVRVDSPMLDKLKKSYRGYGHEEGFIRSKYFKAYPIVVVNHDNARILNNLARAWYPVNSMTTFGSGLIKVGETCKQIVHTALNLNQPIDESIESKVIISETSHYSIGNEYVCRAMCIILLKMET
ncbi:MAG: hypothetical protein GY866_36500 [Proteobacteria bacterium]|nr:hypothetical protein [Pseudomonadota bacterium]